MPISIYLFRVLKSENSPSTVGYPTKSLQTTTRTGQTTIHSLKIRPSDLIKISCFVITMQLLALTLTLATLGNMALANPASSPAPIENLNKLAVSIAKGESIPADIKVHLGRREDLFCGQACEGTCCCNVCETLEGAYFCTIECGILEESGACNGNC